MVIYGLFCGDECYYIGSTNNADRRKVEHEKAMQKGIHKIKQINNRDDITFKELLVIGTDNSFVRLMSEFCMNSIYKPKNKCVYMCGRNRIIVARCNVDLAIKILNVIKKEVKINHST